MNRPFSNNLDKNDRVLDVVSNRQGKVNVQPREATRMTKVLFDGKSSAVYVDVMNLRLVLNGKAAEDVPPIDGEPPPLPSAKVAGPAAAAPLGQGDPLELLRAQHAGNESEKLVITARFKELTTANERLDRAITALTA